MERYEYYVSNPTNRDILVGDTLVKAYAKNVLVTITTKEADDLDEAKPKWTVSRRDADFELGTKGVGNAGAGAYPINVVGITQAAYDALTVKDPKTLYAVV